MRNKYINYIASLSSGMILAILGLSLLFNACKKDETNDTVELKSFGPMPIARGAELKFIGANMDKVSSVVLPGGQEITAFGTKSAGLLTITVPQDATPGLVILKTPQGDITTKTPIGYSEPISIASFSPAELRVGQELTITGDYLNLVKEVIFTDRASVTTFISQSRKELKLIVPEKAQTGLITVSNGAKDPSLTYSANKLKVSLPAMTSVLPSPVKAGTSLSIVGTNLDLVKSVVLGANSKKASFVSQTATEIIVTVPADVQEGNVVLIPASGVEVVFATPLSLVIPTVAVAATTLKNSSDVTVTGTNLDLVDKVVFGDNKEGTIKTGGTPTQITVTVPDNAITGVVKFVTKALKSVNGPNITIIDPVFSSFSPLAARTKTNLTVVGTDLDLVTDVTFEGGVKGTIGARTSTQLTVTVPVGAKTGKVTLTSKNGLQYVSASSLTILANLPTFTSYSHEIGFLGRKLTINGTDMQLIKELIFPGNIVATAYGEKSSTKVEVYIPEKVTRGLGQISLLTYEGDEGILPNLYFGSLDPTTANTVMVMDYEQHGNHNGGWDNGWAGHTSIITEGGNTFVKTTGALNGWFMNCNHQSNGALGPIINNVENYVLKLDVRVDSGVTGAEKAAMQFIFEGRWDFWFGAGLFPVSTGGEWLTITIPASKLKLSGTLDLSSKDYGLSGDNIPAGISVDNMRFEKIQ